jgi:oligoribonuclease
MAHPNSNQKGTKYQNPAHLLWVDLEMTGLDASKDSILEIAAIITDWDFNILDSYEAVVHQTDQILSGMNDWCKNQFKLNGLTERVRQSNIGLKDAQDATLSLISKYFGDDIPVLLAGNSIHSDRAFIAQHLKRLEDRLHYRMLDVSSFKVVFQTKYRRVFAKGESHRALDDIKESIAELKFYLNGVKK